MKSIQKILWLLIVINIGISQALPLTQRYLNPADMENVNYTRGTYLIILADPSLEVILREGSTGDFIHYKKTQGYNVEIVDINDIATTGNVPLKLRQYLENYYVENPLLEYVLLVGDEGGTYSIPAFKIWSYSVQEEDVTDHKYTFFDVDPLTPDFFIGRWPINTTDELEKIKMRTIGYQTMHFPGSATPLPSSHLNNALMVAGNYGEPDPSIIITPVWTSRWLRDELINYGYSKVDTAFWQAGDDQTDNSAIVDSWNQGVGLVGYRGWGGPTGWAYPEFRNTDLDVLTNIWELPVIFSFVCKTGQFNRVSGDCFAETAITAGSPGNPTGSVAVVAPSDKDTDTKFNNPIYSTMMDALLENRAPELGPALHLGKQCLIKEFGNLIAPNDYGFNGTYAEFYHYVYNVIGDPSLPVWLGEPKNMKTTDLSEDQSLSSSYIFTIVTDGVGEPLLDVVGALMDGNELIGKGLSNQQGKLVINFLGNVSVGSNLELYLNKAQFYQKKINLHYEYENDNGDDAPPINYQLVSVDSSYLYTFIDSESDHSQAPVYNWIEINEIGDNLNLTDDSLIPDLDLGFGFDYYGITYTKITVCSNGWASFKPCLKVEGANNECTPIPYFSNNSIGHAMGPYAMIAPFFDDLDDNGQTVPFNVYFYSNGVDVAIIEWDHIVNGETDGNCVGNPESCHWETFQLILDGATTSPSGNGKIIFQYKEIYDIDDHGSTVGIESHEKNTGVQYLFNYSLSKNATGLQDGLAIRFTDNCIGEVPVHWCDCIGNIEDCNGECGGNAVIDECGVCGGESTCMGVEKKLIPQNYMINSYPNPFNPVVTVSLAISKMGLVSVGVFDIRGRKVATIVNQNYSPGYYSVNWNASDYSSGVYFITLTTSDNKLTQKVLLIK